MADLFSQGFLLRVYERSINLMKPYFDALKSYIEQHPPNYGDGESVLGMLYECHNENSPYDNEQIRADFNELYQQMNGMPLNPL